MCSEIRESLLINTKRIERFSSEFLYTLQSLFMYCRRQLIDLVTMKPFCRLWWHLCKHRFFFNRKSRIACLFPRMLSFGPLIDRSIEIFYGIHYILANFICELCNKSTKLFKMHLPNLCVQQKYVRAFTISFSPRYLHDKRNQMKSRRNNVSIFDTQAIWLKIIWWFKKTYKNFWHRIIALIQQCLIFIIIYYYYSDGKFNSR